MVNPDAELIDLDTFKEFQQNSELRARLLEAFARMASFYGFDVSGGEDSPGVTPGTDFEEVARRSWLCNFDHNHLRITRIIRYEIRVFVMRYLLLANISQMPPRSRPGEGRCCVLPSTGK